MITHPFLPVFDSSSRVLILGSFPSVLSRKNGFYYSNSNNRFWKLLELLFNEKIGDLKDDKIEFLLRHNIALYDCAISCDIKGSLDCNMQNITPVDLIPILANSSIKQVFANGGKAYEIATKFLDKQIRDFTRTDIIKLPSTSPANAKFSIQMLLMHWQVLLDY